MKLVLIFLALLVMFLANYTLAAEKKPITVQCQYRSFDEGLIQATANNHESAFDKVATKCFNRRKKRYEKARGEISEDPGLLYIDECINNVHCTVQI